jgi:hypothetical protein
MEGIMVEFSSKHLTKITMKPQKNAQIKSVPAGFITEKKRKFNLIGFDKSSSLSWNDSTESNAFNRFLNRLILVVNILFSPIDKLREKHDTEIFWLNFSSETYVLMIGERYKN